MKNEDKSNLRKIYDDDRKRLNKRKINRRKFLKSSVKAAVKLGIIGAGAYSAVKYDEGMRGKIGELEKKINNDNTLRRPNDGEYDMDTRMITDWMQIPTIVNATYKIRVEMTYTDFDLVDKDGIPRKIERAQDGTGILLPYGKIITAGHVLDVDKILEKTFFSFDKGKLTDVKYMIIIDGERYEFDKIVHEIGEQDIGIGIAGKLPKTVYWDGPMGDYHELRRGNILYEVGNGLRAGEQLRQGIYAGPAEGHMEHEGLLHMTAGTNPGDSGGPVFAVRDGKFEYIGLVVAGLMFGQYIADDLTLFEGLEAKTLK